MLLIFVFSAASAIAVLGLGHLVARRIAPAAGVPVMGLLGLFSLAVVGTALNLVAPVGPWVAAVALVSGLAAFALNARRILAGTSPLTVAALVALLAGFTFASDVPWRHYDLGLYWLQAVKWIAESRQPLGIATLDARLGFNSSWFPVAALLEHPLAIGRSGFLLTPVVLLLGAWLSLDGLRAILAGRRTFAQLLAASTGLVVVVCAGGLGGHSPDAAAAVIGFAVFVSWAMAFEAEDGARRSHVSAAIGLAALAGTVKLSSLVLLGAAPALLLLLRRRPGERVPATTGAVPAAILLVPWLLRGYMASGCPLFPFTVACAPVPWATPARIGEEVTRWIRSWARVPNALPEETLMGWGWVARWASDMSGIWSMRLLLALLLSGLTAMTLLRQRATPGALPLLCVAATGVTVWFLGAPDPRFGWAYLFALALVPSCEALARGLAGRGSRWVAGLGGGVALAAGIVFGMEAIDWRGLAAESSFPLVEWPALPDGASVTREMETLAGLKVRVPVEGDQCWEAPRPCTPHLDPGLSNDGMFRTATVAPGP